MLISSVIGSLEHDARMEIARAETTPDYREVVVHLSRARRLQAMAQAVRQVAEADVLAAPRTAVVVPLRKRSAGRVAVAASKAVKINVWEFWRMHGEAVAAIRAIYGDRWKVTSPFGQTVLATVASGWKSAKTERGTVVKWPADGRMPAAQYWHGGELPAGLVISEDYPRVAGECPRERSRVWFRECVRIRRWYGREAPEWQKYTDSARDALAKMRVIPPSVALPLVEHDAAWHHAHGYVWVGGKVGWTSELGHRASQAHRLAMADNRAYWRDVEVRETGLAYGPQPLHPFADIADDLELAEAAD